MAELSARSSGSYACPQRHVASHVSDTRRLGALNAFAEHGDAFDANSHKLATVYAALGALALGSLVLHQQMTAAVQSRDIIGQAKGMLMERYEIDAEQAFDILRKLSQSSNTSLRTVASQLVAAGPDD